MNRLIFFAALALASAAQAADYGFTALAQSNGFALYGAPVLNNGGVVAWRVSLRNGSDAIVHASAPGELTVVASDAARFSRFGNPSINDEVLVAFEASLDRVTGEGIFRGRVKIAGTRDAGDFDFVRTSPSINGRGTVAFSGERIVGGDFIDGVYVGRGLEVRAVYDTTARFSDFNGNPAINDAGTVAFLANRVGGGSGLFIGSGGPPVTVADDSGLLVGSLAWSDPSLNERGEVAFMAGTNEDFGDNGSATGAGIFLWRNGVLETVVQGGFDVFFSLGDPSLNNLGVVAYVKEPTFGEQVLVSGADRVLGTGDLLFGRTVSGIVMTREGLNDSGQLAFIAFFTDGGSAVVLATPL